ncbi:cytochrome b/b6 domain-containing protein [Chryseobacterium rhizoplanae]|uniref:cytochrome b/b6 domain-containing protein n=1 Tax=Chryseobacterium rhizoplanae TaxID=1609531 RepID=UPI001CE39203|nr:cytochrome b/b6 domain-containing protein [Chryseobacterium rhizoplanae]UCA61726.1 cytochrome b/b6 domain-containing protein [Chryseobacterium rhizoplanae]
MKFQQKFTLFHRLLHWIMALAMPILFITGFLRMYWMNKNHITGIIESKTSAIPKEQITDIAKSIREPMWQWHEVFANIIIFSFLARIIYMLVKGIRFPNPFKSNQPLKELLQGFTYVYFYLFVFISAVTGICIEKGFFPQWKEEIEIVHKWGIYWFPIFIFLHLMGIVIAEFSDKKGIASKMIGGD